MFSFIVRDQEFLPPELTRQNPRLGKRKKGTEATEVHIMNNIWKGITAGVSATEKDLKKSETRVGVLLQRLWFSTSF